MNPNTETNAVNIANAAHKPNKKKSVAKTKQQKRRRTLVTVQLVSSVALIIVGSGLLISGFVVPPAGEIHPSVLIAFGEILTFVGALFGIDYRYKIKSGV